MEMIKIFKDMSDSDLKSIWEKYVRAKEVGKPVKALENMRESGKMNFIQKTFCNSHGL